MIAGNTNYIEVEEVTSTNDYLKKLATKKELPEGFVVRANYQKNGRGQGKNNWESAPEKNLIFSLLLQPTFLQAKNMFMISKVISLSIIDYLKSLDKHFTIKWPNDLYYNNKKIGGILIENQLLGSNLKYSLIGIGLNINQTHFTSDAPNPISLYNIFSKEYNIQTCLSNILSHIKIWYNILSDGLYNKIDETYYANLFRNSGFHDYIADSETFSARILSVENDGKLILETPQGIIKSFYFKEVEFVI